MFNKTKVDIFCKIKNVVASRESRLSRYEYLILTINYSFRINGKTITSSIILDEYDYIFGGADRILKIANNTDKVKKLMKKDIMKIIKKARKNLKKKMEEEDIQGQVKELNKKLRNTKFYIEIGM